MKAYVVTGQFGVDAVTVNIIQYCVDRTIKLMHMKRKSQCQHFIESITNGMIPVVSICT